MRLTASMMLASLAWTACSIAGRATVEVDRPFSLKVGEFVRVVPGELQVGFDGVSNDSRCPKGERCVQAGDATVRIWLQRGAGPRQARELRAVRGTPPVQAQAHEIELMGLEPYPVAARPIGAGDYMITLVLHRSNPSAPTE